MAMFDILVKANLASQGNGYDISGFTPSQGGPRSCKPAPQAVLNVMNIAGYLFDKRHNRRYRQRNIQPRLSGWAPIGSIVAATTTGIDTGSSGTSEFPAAITVVP
jgi:hypothetical protein